MWGTQIRQWDDIDVRDFSVDQGLYTAILYEQLENSLTSTSYDNYCGTSDKPLHGDRNIRNICATILNYLETTYSKSDHTYDPYDVCKLLNYWVYNSLNNVLHFYNSNNFNKISKVHGDIVLKWNNFNDDKLKETENKTCKPIIDIAVYNDWEKRKELYEYYVDYSPIKNFLDFYPQGCRKFYHYVESKKKLYEHFKKHCTSDKKKGCPDFYEQCEKYDPEKVLPRLDCYHEIKQERDAAALSIPQLRDEHSVNEPNSEGTDAGMKPFDDPNLSGNPHTVTKLGNVFLGVVATTMTSGALYRFTPLGGMIRNGLGWNTNNMRNFNGGDIRLYDYAAEPFNPYPGEEHYIGYHPA